MQHSFVGKNVILYGVFNKKRIVIHKISNAGLIANNHSKFSDCIVDEFNLADVPGKGWSNLTDVQISAFAGDNKEGEYGLIFASKLNKGSAGFFARIGGTFMNFSYMCGENIGNETKVFEFDFPYYKNIFRQKYRKDLFKPMNLFSRANIALLRSSEVSNGYSNFLLFLAKNDSMVVSDVCTDFRFESVDFGRFNENQSFLTLERFGNNTIFSHELDIESIKDCRYSINSKDKKYYKINTKSEDTLVLLQPSPYDQNNDNGYKSYDILHITQDSLINVYVVNLNKIEKIKYTYHKHIYDKYYDNVKKLMISKYDKIDDKFTLSDSVNVVFIGIIDNRMENIKIFSNCIDENTTSIFLTVLHFNQYNDNYQFTIFSVCIKNNKLFLSRIFCSEFINKIDYGFYYNIYDNFDYQICSELSESDYSVNTIKGSLDEIKQCKKIVFKKKKMSRHCSNSTGVSDEDIYYSIDDKTFGNITSFIPYNNSSNLYNKTNGLFLPSGNIVSHTTISNIYSTENKKSNATYFIYIYISIGILIAICIFSYLFFHFKKLCNTKYVCIRNDKDSFECKILEDKDLSEANQCKKLIDDDSSENSFIQCVETYNPKDKDLPKANQSGTFQTLTVEVEVHPCPIDCNNEISV